MSEPISLVPSGSIRSVCLCYSRTLYADEHFASRWFGEVERSSGGWLSWLGIDKINASLCAQPWFILCILSPFKRPFSRWIWVSRHQKVSILGFNGDKGNGGGGDNCSYKTCKAPLKSTPPTYQHPVLLQAGRPSCRPTNSVIFCLGLFIYVYSTNNVFGMRTRIKAAAGKHASPLVRHPSSAGCIARTRSLQSTGGSSADNCVRVSYLAVEWRSAKTIHCHHLATITITTAALSVECQNNSQLEPTPPNTVKSAT